MIYDTGFEFFDFDIFSQNSQFCISAISWSNFNWSTWFDCPIVSHLYHILLTLRIESESRHMLYKIVLSAIICHFCEKLMIAHAALVLKDTFAPRFAIIQAIMDPVEFLENYEVILATFSSSCCYMLSFSFFFVVFIICDVGQTVWCIKCH